MNENFNEKEKLNKIGKMNSGDFLLMLGGLASIAIVIILAAFLIL
ncbi:hypothetical protein [Virgibacillus phasianinus]|nr:hypothetical protein [Virgibacillus phasianinus]